MDDVEDIYYLNKIIIVQRLEDAKICGGPWIVGGVMRHEHLRDQSCLVDWSNLYQSKETLRTKKKKK